MSFEHFHQSEAPALGYLHDGSAVINRPHSHIDTNNPNLDYLEDALSEIDPKDETFIVQTVTFQENIGESICVETDDEDEIVYARRHGRNGYTRFVKNKAAEKTKEITVVLKKDEYAKDPTYILITAFAGPKAEPEPWDKKATTQSRIFWDSHALIFDTEMIIEGSEQKDCPW